MRDVYPSTHWAVRGEPPAFDTPDEDVYLEGRNVVLLTKAAVFMARERLTRVAIGPLAGNPFPDATADFFEAMGRALSIGLAAAIAIEAPFAALHKADVIRLGLSLGVPLELTLSCMQPLRGAHCGRCSKCRERRDAFREAGVPDPARYSTVPLRRGTN
jgi:7-cyano-7-deazaguanine synthase